MSKRWECSSVVWGPPSKRRCVLAQALQKQTKATGKNENVMLQLHGFLVALSGMGGREVRSVLLSSFRVLGELIQPLFSFSTR